MYTYQLHYDLINFSKDIFVLTSNHLRRKLRKGFNVYKYGKSLSYIFILNSQKQNEIEIELKKIIEKENEKRERSSRKA